MQRFYQGQLDFFCAVYAVINALTALYGINLAQGRALFASMLYDISKHPGLWRTTLENKTDFHWLAEHMLFACQKGSSYPLRVHRPFASVRDIPERAADLALAGAFTDVACHDDFARPGGGKAMWAELEQWLAGADAQPRAGTVRRVAVLRFHRYMRLVDTPIVSHWSVADHHHKGVIHLRDASKEENAVYSFDKDATAFSRDGVSETRFVRIEPESVFFVERR